MKKVMMILGCAGLLMTQSCAQEHANTNVPETVKDAFTAKFPNVSKADWEMENDDEWEAEFKQNGTDYSAKFALDGRWLETEYKIKASQLPAEVSATLDRDFSGYKIEKAEVAETPDGEVYEIEIEKGESDMEVVIDGSGKVIKKEMKEDKDEEGDHEDEDDDDEDDEEDDD
ncbi:MAG: PepSY-like domain-containing protein [Crocinitomicaceae bacterium]|nr:PepSY-like domain-containing protein [Crocinitomicaceae bacterium]